MKITDAFLGEHAVFYAQFSECEDMIARVDLAGVKHAAGVIASALATHADLEDTLLFQPLAARADVGESIFQIMDEEHRTIGALLVEIARTHDPERGRDLLMDMIHAAREHFLKEEQIAFPLAERLLGVAELDRLGVAWSEARNVTVEVSVDQHVTLEPAAPNIVL